MERADGAGGAVLPSLPADAGRVSDALPGLHEDAIAVGAFRVLRNGTGRAYGLVQAESGRPAIARMLRMAAAFGYVTASHSESYAMLDIYDDDETIVQDYSIPTAQAFRWWKAKLGLRVREVLR